MDVTQSVDESEPTETNEPSASSDSQEIYSSTLIPIDEDFTTPKSGKEKGDDEEDDGEVEYEIVESDTCDDGEWVDADDVTVSFFF